MGAPPGTVEYRDALQVEARVALRDVERSDVAPPHQGPESRAHRDHSNLSDVQLRAAPPHAAKAHDRRVSRRLSPIVTALGPTPLPSLPVPVESALDFLRFFVFSFPLLVE